MKDQIAFENKGNANEKLLFHGTDKKLQQKEFKILVLMIDGGLNLEDLEEVLILQMML